MPALIAVLGAGLSPDGKSLDWESVERCRAALRRYRCETQTGTQVFVLLAPGCRIHDRRYHDIPTMASLMAQWFLNQNVPSEHMVVNQDDRGLWGTAAEVTWHLRQLEKKMREINHANSHAVALGDMSPALYVPVTNWLHGWRVTRSYLLATRVTCVQHFLGIGEPWGMSQSFPTIQVERSKEVTGWSRARLVSQVLRECAAHAYLRRQHRGL